MIGRMALPEEDVGRCLLCHEAPCTVACPHGLDPAGLLRSLRFENEAGAARRLPREDLCAGCDAPCETACLRRDQPVPIRRVCTALHGEKAGLEELGEAPVDLSSTFCGVKLENPFLLSSSVVASSYEKIARAFDMGWAGACFKTICDFIPREASPRYSALSGGNGFYGFKNIEQLSCDSVEEDLDIIRRLKRDYPTKVIIASIMGRDEAEWTRLARLVEEAGADMVECNFSCPNMAWGWTWARARRRWSAIPPPPGGAVTSPCWPSSPPTWGTCGPWPWPPGGAAPTAWPPSTPSRASWA